MECWDILWPLAISILCFSIELTVNYIIFDQSGVELSTVIYQSVSEASTVICQCQSVSEASTVICQCQSVSEVSTVIYPDKKYDFFISDMDIAKSQIAKFILIFGYICCLSIAIPEMVNIIMDLLYINSESMVNPYIESVIAQSSNIITDLLCKSAHSAMVIASSSDNPSIAADNFVHMAGDVEAVMYEIIVNTKQLILASPDVNDQMIIAANESIDALQRGALDFIDNLYLQFDPIISDKHK